MNYIKITIQADEPKQEEFIAILSDMDANGFEQSENEMDVYFDETQFDRTAVFQALSSASYQLQEVSERNWNEEWERNFQPVVIENFCAVRADFHPAFTNVEHEIIITPKMSFGTGHHATTYMMIQQMQQFHFQGKSVFDFGTGTGILAILAEKMGAASVEAIDVDEWSIANAKENFGMNNCSRITVSLTSALPRKRFDIVLANINRNVLLQYAAELKDITTSDGLLLLSGLLTTDEEVITSAFAESYRMVKKLERSNWVSLLMEPLK